LKQQITTEQAPPWTRPGDDYAAWKRQTALTALLLFAITCVVSRIRAPFFPLYQVQSQDLLPLFVLSISLMVATFWTPPWRLPAGLPKASWLVIIGVTMVGCLAYGTHALMENFPLSIDERMVVFDMAVFDRMHLAAPLAEGWRPYAKALVPAFLLNENMPTGLVSSYLPMNALLRLAFSKLVDPALLNPLLALAGGAALLDIARRVFGHENPACWVVLLVYALSAQMLVNAMTVYSMTAHMALNLIWLAAFLRGGRLGHSMAILTGFVATGLHQLAFHPFFVAPFLLWRLRHREWKIVLLYGAAYTAIILWWLYYPLLAGHEVANALQPPPNSSLAGRISTAFAERRGDTVPTTFFNLMRFFAWQNAALLPLLSAAIAVAVRKRGLPAVLLFGIALWLSFITVVIPFQGHGWGYRYLHPYLGSFALLGGYGYEELRATIGRTIDGFVLTLSGVTALVTIPLLLMAAHRFVAPYVAVERLVARQRAPMVLIDTYALSTSDGRWAGNAIETVRNLPDLSNRPLRFSSAGMNPELLAGLCRRGHVALISRADQHRVGLALNTSANSPSFKELVDPVQRRMPHCFVSAAGSSE
jgi:hypothetical protein